MCRVGEFNLSQASLTSAEALTALRELLRTNPALHKEFTGEEKVMTIDEGDELEFSEDCDHDDESDIPIDVVVNHVLSEGSTPIAGFVVDDEGGLTRTGSAEDSDVEENGELDNKVDVEVPVVIQLGRGHRIKRSPKVWEM